MELLESRIVRPREVDIKKDGITRDSAQHPAVESTACRKALRNKAVASLSWAASGTLFIPRPPAETTFRPGKGAKLIFILINLTA